MLSFGALAAKVFGSANDRKIKAYRPTVDEINALEPELEKLTDQELRARTEVFRKQLADGTGLDELLVPAFATVREAARRTLLAVVLQDIKLERILDRRVSRDERDEILWN